MIERRHGFIVGFGFGDGSCMYLLCVFKPSNETQKGVLGT